jgi:hypothetical protein
MGPGQSEGRARGGGNSTANDTSIIKPETPRRIYPGPVCTLYALASLRAAAAEVQRVLLRLLARLGVDHDLAYCYPAIVADVRTLVLVVVVLVFSGWVRVGCGRVLHVNTSGVLAVPPGD